MTPLIRNSFVICRKLRILIAPCAIAAAGAIFAFGGSAATAADDSAQPPAGFQSLFDGKTLDGWEGDAKIFRVDDGAIVGGSLQDKIEHNHFLATKAQFENFELRLKARLVGQGDNAGVQFRSQRIPNHHEVIGYQADIGLAGEQNIWGALYDESRRRKFLATGDNEQLQKLVNKDGWNELVVRCEGPRIQIWVNGLQTVDYTEAEPDIARKGILAVQIHSGAPAEAAYKDIWVRKLP